MMEGDEVLLHQPTQLPNKMKPLYDLAPYKITEKKGSMVTAKHNGKTITRNVSFFRPFIGGDPFLDPEPATQTRPESPSARVGLTIPNAEPFILA